MMYTLGGGEGQIAVGGSPDTSISSRSSLVMELRKWEKSPSNGLDWPRSTSLMLITLECSVSME